MRRFCLAMIVLAAPALAQDSEGPDAAKVAADAAVTAGACLDAAGNDLDARLHCVGGTYQDCLSSAETPNTIAQTECAAGELEYWKAELKSTYDALYALRAKEDAEAKDNINRAAALETAQKAWLGWRGAECAYDATFFGAGSGSGPALFICEMDLTGKRAISLQAEVQAETR